MRNLLAIFGCLMFLSGCGSSAPECSDATVQDLVMEITKEELFKQFLTIELPKNYELIVEETRGTDVYKEYEKFDFQGEGFVYGSMPVEYFMKFVKVSAAAEAMKDIIESQINDLNISLTGIRMDSKDDQAMKTVCSASVAASNGKTFPIKYFAQSTEDDQIYVEVSGL